MYHKTSSTRLAAGAAVLTRSAKALAAIFAMLIATTSASAQALADADITAAIEREYLYDDAVPFNRVHVDSQNGIITLTGIVPNLTARRQAEALAGIVRGVRSVVNQIDVENSDRAPSEIRTSILDALAMDPATDRFAIDVTVDETGVANLSGETDSWVERSMAETVAGTIAGVTRIENDLTVDFARVHRGPGEISEEISQRMRWDVRIDDSLVNVLVRDGGRVILSGTVGSFAEKQHADQLAWVRGVSEVDSSSLDVESWARDDDLRRDIYSDRRSDSEVLAAVELALRYDPRVIRESVSARVDDGVVWLSGDVERLAASRAAERDAMNTVGVRRVHNHIRIRRDHASDDATIERHTRDALRGRGLLDDSIRLSVDQGRAVLEGDVDSIVEYWQATLVVESIRGIEELRNDLTIRNQPPRIATQWYSSTRGAPMPQPYFAGPGFDLKTDRELYEDIESELFWSPFVDENEVMVDIDDGTVTLSGSVDSYQESRAAVLNAYEAGAQTVRNQMTIQYQ